MSAELQAGREMDAAVHQRVMKRGPVRMLIALDGTVTFDTDGFEVPPDYSTDIAAAWTVVEHFTAREYGKVRVSTSYYHGYHAHICWGPGVDGEGSSPEGVYGGTAPEAICRAALAAVSRLPG
jgi:hypothetical protein